MRRRLRGAVGYVCPYWMRDQREDLIQVSVMRIMKLRRRSETKDDFSASYLKKVAYTVMVDEMRKMRSRQEISDEVLDSGPDPRGAPPGPERQVASKEISKSVRVCLQTLVVNRQEAVTLYLLGYKVPQISQRMGWDRKRASNLVYRGLADLRECLQQQGVRP